MTELAKRAAQQIAEYCGRGTPERLAEIIDSAGVRELTAKLEALNQQLINLRTWEKAEYERVRELTEALEKTLVIARQALVYFNTESGREAMKELEKIEARIKGDL
jgi:hypothetical protein